MSKAPSCDCKHWERTGRFFEGRCALKSRMVPLDDCAACDQYDGSATKLVQLRNRVREMQEKRQANIEAVRAGLPVTVEAPEGGRSCGTKVIRWLGMRWYGTPAPIRWWRAWYYFDPAKHAGCGCVVKLKNGSLAIRRCWQAVLWWWSS